MSTSSTSQIEYGQCPICLDPMSKNGEHQISSLPCGHLFGYCCIKRWVEEENQQICPTCRKYATVSMIRLLIWDGGIPLDNMRNDEIKEEHNRVIKIRKDLLQKLARLERDSNICQSEISSKRSSIFGRSRTTKTIISKPTSFPSLILERPINEGFRVSLTSKHLFYTCKKDNQSFGVEFCERESPSSQQFFKFIPLHSAQIYDLSPSPYDKEAIATVSLDKKVLVTAVRSELPIMESTLPVPLWSCCWAAPNSLAVGGTNGRFFIVDGRGGVRHEFELAKGPPVVSIQPFSDNVIIVSSPLKTSLFDLAKCEFLTDSCYNVGTGSHSIKVAKIASARPKIDQANLPSVTKGGAQSFILISRLKNNRASYCLGTKYPAGKISINRTFNLAKYEIIARPDILTICGNDQEKIESKDIFAVPDEASLGFKLVSSSNTSIDYWNLWKNNFVNPQFPSPVIDISLQKDVDLCMAAVSSELLRLYSFPF